MADYEEMYKGRKIIIREENNERKLFIDDKPVQAFRHASGGYSSWEIAHNQYGSLAELARAMVEKMPQQ